MPSQLNPARSVAVAARPQPSPVVPSEEALRLLRLAASYGDIRRKVAERDAPFYTIVAYHPGVRRVWVQGQGQVPCAVHWETLRCGCPDAANTLHGVETRLRHAGYPSERIWCKHVHMVPEIIARMVSDAGWDILEFSDFMSALIAVAPALPLVPLPYAPMQEVQA